MTKRKKITFYIDIQEDEESDLEKVVEEELNNFPYIPEDLTIEDDSGEVNNVDIQ